VSTLQYPERPSVPKVLQNLLARIRRLEAIPPPPAVYEIKLFADAVWSDSVAIVVTGDSRFVFMIAQDLDLWYLWQVEAYITTVGSDDVVVQVRRVNGNVDMLSTPVTIPAGEFTSCGEDYVVDDDVSQVTGCELIALDVDEAGGGVAKGLGVILTFRTGPVPSSST
jgi:hypothetical protein